MAEAARDLYAILGVARDVDADALRTAYRKLARKYHPDVNPGDKAAEERFKEISRAYDVLSDAEKRRNYDEFGEVSLEAGFDAKRAREAKERFEARFGRGAGAASRRPAPRVSSSAISTTCSGATSAAAAATAATCACAAPTSSPTSSSTCSTRCAAARTSLRLAREGAGRAA